MQRLLLLLPIGILAISTASIFVKLCDAPSLIIAVYRISVASLLLLPLAAHQKIWTRWARKDVPWLLLSGLFLSLHFAFWIASLKFTSVASSVVLVTTQPIFVTLWERFFLKEKRGPSFLLAIGLSLLGSVMIGYGDLRLSGVALWGDGLAVLGAITASGYFLVGRKMRKGQDLLTYIFPVYSMAGAVLIVLSLIFRQPFTGYSAPTYLFFILLAVVPQLIGHTTFNWALKFLPASMVVIAILGEPVGSTILAYFILGEGLTLWKVLGGISIFTGIVIALRTHR